MRELGERGLVRAGKDISNPGLPWGRSNAAGDKQCGAVVM